ncbi:MAG TPA: nucleoid occlusion factor SlmA [Variovorax sp.]|nr:nucleoid occlusion factor SlmA [Variovorax sp.]
MAVLVPGTTVSSGAVALLTRRRPKPGERRVQIMQTLAAMLERPGGERVTTAALAAELDVSEAALYRHFASKAQMLEGLIEFIEQSVFVDIDRILGHEAMVRERVASIITALMQFAEKNAGMARVMVGDALVYENERLQNRMNQFFDRIESTLGKVLREDATADGASLSLLDAQVQAGVLTAFVVGRLQRFTRSGFKRLPTEHLELALGRLV